jgi:hypothetical protein
MSFAVPMRLIGVAVVLSASIFGCATTKLPSWPSAHATRYAVAIRPDLTNRVFWLRSDKMKCEESAKFLRNLQSTWTFGPCVRADLQPGSEYWAFTFSRLGDQTVVGSTVKQHCEQEATQLIGPWARCVPTSIRFLDSRAP